MGKRDRLRALFAPSATGSRSASPNSASPLLPQLPPTPAQRAPPPPPSSSSTPDSIAYYGGTPAQTVARNPALEKAIALQLQKLPEAGRTAFEREMSTLDEQALLSRIRAYDAEHNNESIIRHHAERLTKVFGLLNNLMGGVAIGIQADPAISAPVVGAVRVAIDLGLQFTRFFPRLSDMVCEFDDYLGPLAEHSRAADVELVESAVISVYTTILNFSWKARCVFVDANGNKRRWTSFRAFMRQHWDTFEAEFVSMKEEMHRHLHVLQHTVQATHFNAFRSAEKRKERSTFLSWLSDIDFEDVHQSIYAKKHKGTGDWLINEPKFQQWMRSPRSSLLWCNGKPGIELSLGACADPTYSANVLEHITAKTGLRKDTAVCFAYYDYRETRLANLAQIIASLIKQLCQRKYDIPNNLLQIMHDARSPSLVGSQEYFLQLTESFSEVFVVFDALDECPEQKRQDILSFITEVVTTPAPSRIRVFATSRREMDITEAFVRYHVPIVQILAENVAVDIETFARSRVEELQARKILFITSDELKEKIIQTLAQKAEGMFLWVNLQLDSLCQASKLRKDQVVEAAMEDLPFGLPNTYVRILDRIERQQTPMRDLALNCLTWTLYAQRPLSVRELQQALAINSKHTAPQDQQIDSQVILEACGNLLEESNGAIRPIHYTVQEFLTATVQGMPQHRIRTQLLDSNSAHSQLGSACLAYTDLMAYSSPTSYEYYLRRRLEMTPLAGYACHSFDYHISNCDKPSVDVMDRLERLFQQESTYLAAILQIKILRDRYDYSDTHERFNRMDFSVTPSTIVYSTKLYNIPTIRQRWIDQTPPAYALHVAASAGLTSAVIRLLEGGCDVNEKDTSDCASLYYTCLNGDLEMLQLLLNRGADVSAQGGWYGNALQAASAGGHTQVVELLLDEGAEVNAQGGWYGNALQAASAGGHTQVVELLLDEGAEVNAQGGKYGNALQAASAGGHTQVVELLLDEGAEVNAQSGKYGNALQAASAEGYTQVVKLLLNKGAKVNAQGGEYFGNALQAASAGGHTQVVELLLNKGAKVNAQGGEYFGNALQAASAGGHTQVVELLLDEGAEVNAQGGKYGNALQAASAGGHTQVVELLLNKGAKVNAQGGEYFGNALQAASAGGYMQIVELLLDEGAEVNAQGGRYYSNALQAASAGGHTQVVELLLNKGAKVNAQGGEYFGNALQAASAGGHMQIVELLLNKGAEVNAQGGRYYSNALQAASAGGHTQVVELLLDKGADVNAQGEEYSNALQAASAGGYTQVVELLLDKGADVNAQGEEYSNALQAASAGGYTQVVELLLNKGAEVNAQGGGYYGNALQAASEKGHEEVVKLLLAAGADETTA
ncbi:hypothetical protein N0V90_012078 [Kalmusia sp. IMI 367209]|nr:hypothetical protein N0V90_012078 [Kalmusia sp. IMI 367209]